MSRWFRHYAGMMRDEKLVAVALRAKQPVERVLWVWGAILESAAEINNGGRYELDTAEVAYFLRSDEADISAILSALADANRVADGALVNWDKRQFQSDKSATRQAAYRQRKRSQGGDGNNRQGDGDVTSLSRNGDCPETDTETDIHDGGERTSLIGEQAYQVASELAAICGHPTPDHWPPGWCGSPLWVQKCLNSGWLPEVMLAETRAVVKRKRDGPPDNFTYLEKPLARAHAQHQAPLPKVEIPAQETINGSNPATAIRGGSALAAIRKVQSGLRGDPDRNAPIGLPKG